jgi:hypothetical protein
MFLDQAIGYYEFLTQGNEINSSRWSDIYIDAFGLGSMVTVIKPAYYRENNISRLIGVAEIDILTSQLIQYIP